MKRAKTILASVLIALPILASAGNDSGIAVSDLSVKGRIEGENIVFTLEFVADVTARNVQIPLAIGDLALYKESKLPKNSELTRQGDRFLLKFQSRGKQSVLFQFASRPIKEQEWRRTSFTIPVSAIRRLLVECDRDDLEIKFPGALKIERNKNENGKMEVTAFLGLTSKFEVRWKPEVKKLSAAAAVECQANTIATASVGAMRLDTIFNYRVIQGSLETINLTIPRNVNVTQVRGDDIRDWTLEKKDRGDHLLVVTLSRPKEGAYKLQVEGDMVLPKFPCPVDLPVVSPKDVMRTSGFLMVGADSAIKLVVKKSMGLTQVDQASFPRDQLTTESKPRVLPTRSAFAYQFANMPYTLKLHADDIVPEYSVDDRLVLKMQDDDVALIASIQLDVRDAGAREVVIETEPAWIVANVSGADVSDYDLRDEGGKRVIHVYFKKEVLGPALLDIRLEHTLKDEAKSFTVPSIRVKDAKSERGHFVLAAERGLRVKASALKGMREIPTGSAPMHVTGAQQAFRFKEAGWSLNVDVERTKPRIHAEIFHLVSIGDGVLYCSSTVNYDIGGAPVRSFTVHVPKDYQNVEFVGRDIRSWNVAEDGETWTVTLQEKAVGKYTLGVMYDRQFNYRGGKVSVGGVHLTDTESEIGYIALASSADLTISEPEEKNLLIGIEPDEIPIGYRLSLLRDPILKAFKYVTTPHMVTVAVKRLDSERLLTQVVDHTMLYTTVTDDGELVTTVTYMMKNASEQYLAVKLPKGATLWHTELRDEKGVLRKVPSRQRPLDENGQLEILIPVRRQREAGKALQVRVVYAESQTVRDWGGTVALRAPDTPYADTTFVRWSVRAPDDRVIAKVSGNMQPETAYGTSSIAGSMAIGPDLTLTATASLMGHLFCNPDDESLLGRLKRIVRYGRKGQDNTASLTETITLQNTDPLKLKVTIAPLWVGPEGSLTWMLALLAVGVVISVRGACKKADSRWALATGLGICALGISYIAAGRAALALGLAAILGAIILWKLLKLGFRVLRVVIRLTIAVVPRVCRSVINLVHKAAAGLASFRAARRERREARAEAELESRMAAIDMPFELDDSVSTPSPEIEPQEEPDGNKDGYGTTRMLLVMLLLALGITTACAKTVQRGPSQRAMIAPTPIVMDSVLMTVEGPGTGREDEKSAEVNAVLEFEIERPISFTVVHAPGVMTKYDLNSRYAKIRSEASGYTLMLEKKGKYKIELSYLLPVVERDGTWNIGLNIPGNMRNVVTLNLPETGMDIKCEQAVHFAKKETEKTTQATAVFGPSRSVTLSWQPRIRKTRLEKVVYFCEANTFASFTPGVVDLAHVVRFQIAQGELKRMELEVPEGMTVSAVRAAGLSTWRFDPEKHLLEAVLEKPATGELILLVRSQVASDNIQEEGSLRGYNASVGALTIVGAARQRGSIAIAAPENMQVRVDKTDGLNAMNPADFSPGAIQAAYGNARRVRPTIKRAFRYHELPVRADVHAEPVLPEIRVVQNGAQLDIQDERIRLTTRLQVSVLKAGVFSLSLDIPEDFDIESLTGDDVSHWDEVEGEDVRVVVHFKNQLKGTRTINLDIVRMEKGIEQTIDVPRVSVKGARKHTGDITISGERGVRISVVDREGVSEQNPGTRATFGRQGLLAFKILRPTWRVVLKTEVISPVIKPEVLQRVDVAEGMLKGHAWIRYKIASAGCKTFYVQSPYPEASLSFSGRKIAKTYLDDKKKGIWRIDLHNKEQDSYAMQVSYQYPFPEANMKQVLVKPVRTIGTEPQKGHVAILSGGRVRVEVVHDTVAGLQPQDARSIPGTFKAGDLSDAIYCFRTVKPDYALALSVQRHGSADVLEAHVEQVNMNSVVANSRGNMLTRVTMQIEVGDNFRFLKVSLPQKDDKLWTVFVNGKVAEPTRQEDVYRIPIERSASDDKENTSVDFVYSSKIPSRVMRSQRFSGPRFNLPLNNVSWTFDVDPAAKYYGFGGTMKYDEESSNGIDVFNAETYTELTGEQLAKNEKRAEESFKDANKYSQLGFRSRTKQALEEAMMFSATQEDREDARIQYHNYARESATAGLLAQRGQMRGGAQGANLPEQQVVDGFNEGNFTQDHVRKVVRSLDDKERIALETWSQRIIDQQAAAAGVKQSISILMPRHGRVLKFSKPIQTKKDVPIVVEFRAVPVSQMDNVWRMAWPLLVMVVVMRWLVGKVIPAPRKESPAIS